MPREETEAIRSVGLRSGATCQERRVVFRGADGGQASHRRHPHLRHRVTQGAAQGGSDPVVLDPLLKAGYRRSPHFGGWIGSDRRQDPVEVLAYTDRSQRFHRRRPSIVIPAVAELFKVGAPEFVHRYRAGGQCLSQGNVA